MLRQVMSQISRAVLVLAASLVLAGCASLSPSEVVSESRADALARAGFTDGAQPGLDTANAVIAAGFESNQDLAADFLDAGLAAADWQSAARPANPVVEFVTFPDDGHGRVYDIDLMASVMGLVATPWRARAARARFEQAQSLAILRAVDYAAELESAWISAIAARQRLDLQARNLSSAEAAMVVAEEIRNAGNSPEIDLARERAFMLQAAMAERSARLEAEQARHALEVLLGRPVDLTALPDRMPDLPANPQMPDRETLHEASLVLDSARRDVEAASQEAGLENWASLLEHAELGLAWEREDRDWHRGWTAEFSLPVFDQGQARRARARLMAEQSLARYAARLAEINSAADNAALTQALALEQWQAVERDVLPASEAVLEETLLQYNAMQLGVFELLRAFEMRIEAGRIWVDAQETAHLAAIQLRRLRAGGSPGNAPDMAAPSSGGRDEGGH